MVAPTRTSGFRCYFSSHRVPLRACTGHRPAPQPAVTSERQVHCICSPLGRAEGRGPSRGASDSSGLCQNTDTARRLGQTARLHKWCSPPLSTVRGGYDASPVPINVPPRPGFLGRTVLLTSPRRACPRGCRMWRGAGTGEMPCYLSIFFVTL